MPYLAGFITPQDYGAAGNGVADDTAAIQAALNAALAGSAVYMPTGTYVTSSPLTIPSYVTLRGAVRQGMYGQNTQASLLKVSSGFSGTAAILIDGTSSAKSGQAIESLSLSGISLVSGSTAGITVLNNAQNVTISDVTVAKFPGAGVAFQFTSGSTFPTGGVLTRVTSWQNTGYGFDLYLTDAQFDRCMAFQNHSHGWRILRGTNNVWSLCRAEH